MDLLSVTFAANVSLSNVITLRHRATLGVFTDAAWTAADMTAQVSVDGVNWWNVKTVGNYGEWCVAMPTATREYNPFPIELLPSQTHIRFRSGTAATPVNQTAARELHLLVRPV